MTGENQPSGSNNLEISDNKIHLLRIEFLPRLRSTSRVREPKFDDQTTPKVLNLEAHLANWNPPKLKSSMISFLMYRAAVSSSALGYIIIIWVTVF